jgi:hypothetical protein
MSTLFCKYKDFTFFEFIVVCEHRSEELPYVWVAHENEVDLLFAIFGVRY